MRNKDHHAAYMHDYYYKRPGYREERIQYQREWRNKNRERHRAYAREWEKSHWTQVLERAHTEPYIERTAAYMRRRNYGVSLEQFNAQLARQNGVCALCGFPETAKNKKRLGVDHDHQTGQPRGLLCLRCNVSLSNFERGFRSRLDPATITRYLAGAWWF